MLKIQINNNRFPVSRVGMEEIVRVIADLSDPNRYDGADCPITPHYFACFYAHLYQSDNPKIREQVAKGINYVLHPGRGGWEKRTAKRVVKTLSKDPQIDVVRVLVKNPVAVSLLSEKRVMALIKRGDVPVLLTIAQSMYNLSRCDLHNVAKALMSTGIPVVRETLASQSEVPVPVLEKLAEDDDPAISLRAVDSIGFAEIEAEDDFPVLEEDSEFDI